MHLSHYARCALALCCTILVSVGCTTMNHPPERVWPAETPGAYPGNTDATANGEWWFPSQIGPMDVPVAGGNKGTLFYKGRSGPPTPRPPDVALTLRRSPEPGVVRRVVYKRVFVEQEVTVERLIFPAITFAYDSAALDAEAHHQLRQAAAAIIRARGYDVRIEGRREETERTELDAERAAVVRATLLDLGLTAGRLSIKLLGAADAIATDDSEIGRELNRSVAFAMIPGALEMDPQGPPDDPMPHVPPGSRLETVEATVTVTVPRLVFIDRLIFPNILFDYDQSSLRPESGMRADRAAAAVQALQSVERLTVVGHCDSIGSQTYNDALSVRRADAVRARLIASGLAPALVHTEGKGKRQPIANNDTVEGRQLNRRVEMHIEYAK